MALTTLLVGLLYMSLQIHIAETFVSILTRSDGTKLAAYSSPATYDAAVAACLASGRFPIGPLSQTEQDDLEELDYFLPSQSWLGFNDREAEGQWKDFEGSNLTYFNWGEGQPNSTSPASDCVIFSSEQNWKWASVDCEETYPYVCMDERLPEETTFAQEETSTIAPALTEPVTENAINGTKKRLLTFIENELASVPQDNALELLNAFDSDVSLHLADAYSNLSVSESLNLQQKGLQIQIFRMNAEGPVSFQKDGRVLLEVETAYNDSATSIAVAIAFDEDFPLWNAILTTRISNERSGFIRTLPRNGTIFQFSSFQRENGNLKKVQVPINFTIDLERDNTALEIASPPRSVAVEGISKECAYLDLATGTWGGSGCERISSDANNVTCACDHTSTFSAVLSFSVVEIPQGLFAMILCVQGVSIVLLGSTLVLYFLARKRLRLDRVLTQVHLTTALLLLNITLTASQTVSNYDSACEAAAVLAHWALLAAFFWMFNHGFVLYGRTCLDPMRFDIKKFAVPLYVVGWALPALIVLLCASISLPFEKYLDVSEMYALQREKAQRNDTYAGSYAVPKYNVCWLSVDSFMVLAAIIPVSVVILLNLVILLRVVLVVWAMSTTSAKFRPSSHSSNSSNQESVRVTFRAFATLSPILGCTWLFGFLVNVPGYENVFIAIHYIMNAVQSVAVFVIFVVVNDDIRKAIQRRLKIPRLQQRRVTVATIETKVPESGA